MNSIERVACAILLIGTGVICPQVSQAQGFTGEAFGTWSETGQDSYIQSSVMMAGVIATQIQPEISSCIDNWYFGTPAAKAERNAEIKALIDQYASYHPSGVILAAVQQACGSFE